MTVLQWHYGHYERVLSGDVRTGREAVRGLFPRRPWHDDGK